MARKKDTNTIQKRLNDAKTTYEYNESQINVFRKYCEKCETLSITASNGTSSMIPEYKSMQELVKTNISLRKQINDMEMLLQNGNIKNEEEADPFK